MSRPILAGAAACTAVAAWLSQGTIASSGAAGARVALLPLSFSAGLIVVLAAGAVLAARRAVASLAPLWLLALLVLPWLSPALPAVFLLWSGPMALLVWTAVALSMGASLIRIQPTEEAIDPDQSRGAATDTAGRRQARAAGLVACAVYAIAA
ncbi:MAG: hypothetical protein ABJC89_16510 [Acidobacteriota bacterium]